MCLRLEQGFTIIAHIYGLAAGVVGSLVTPTPS